MKRLSKPGGVGLLLVALASVAIIGAMLMAREPALIVMTQSGRKVLEVPVFTGFEFAIEFTHSVARTPVVEKLRVEQDGVLLVYETVYQDFGAGLPHEPDEGAVMTVDSSGIRITGMSRRFREVNLTVGSIARHRIHIPGRTIGLLDLVDSGTRITVKVAKHGRLISLVEGVLSKWLKRTGMP